MTRPLSQNLGDKLRPRSTFRDAARLTAATAKEIFGKGSLEEKAVREGWKIPV